MGAITPLLLILTAAWTAYGAYGDRYDRDLLSGRICTVMLLGGISLPTFIPALWLPLLLAALAGLIGMIYFSRRVYDY